LLRSFDTAFLDLQRQVDEMFEELIYRPWAISGRAGWRPPLDLHETSEAYIVEIDLPGVTPEEVRVLVSEHNLIVTGRRQANPPDGVLFQQCERRCGPLQRALNLPRAVDPQQTRAEYRHGTCRIYLPKKRQPEEPAQHTAHSVEGSHFIIQVAVP
jgi:HSP20 family protein